MSIACRPGSSTLFFAFDEVFVDSDQLADLTQPLSIVGYEVKSVILLGSKKVLKQKWCVAEIVVARLEGVRTVLVTTPDFRMPDATFVTNYMTSVPGIGELASYGIGYREIKDTILWVCKLEELPLVRLEPEALNCVVDGLSGCHGPKIPLLEACEVAILADPKNMAASATAYVLRAMLDPEVFKIGLGSCSVLSQQLLPKASRREKGQDLFRRSRSRCSSSVPRAASTRSR